MSGARRRLVDDLRGKGIADTAVLGAIAQTPRHAFVPSGVAHRAYEDSALPIGSGQTISQPFIHARSLELLQAAGRDRVLEVGTGSGYQTALLARLAGHVYSVERVPELHERAAASLRAVGVTNVSLACADGTEGWPAHAPYDGIIVGAGSPEVPLPLAGQLAQGGRLVVPVGGRDEQRLVLIERQGNQLLRSEFDLVRFVPLVGAHGWEP
ncbi:MAG TPA: protein-L-isoaspartate(D-aspartate) O-methyltransferase [Gemmatimonadaceae bacterium]|nr:protein-L-isoaspartate(D-aspartate) O-methyltransferase [Gemmatimonadaceae bacterium]